ncbi:MAG: 4Fe-4S binding protein [Candidatus Aminicenantes bacterium]|nr:4Fe-4S binding protein [Candidatus Aminicenantes bacterium]
MSYYGDLKPMIGKIHIDKNQCKGCGFCVEYCPKDILELSEEFNAKGYHPPFVKNEDECCYCQLCETICPEFAIFVTLKKEEEEVEKSESRP